jgi:hypothetical protein
MQICIDKRHWFRLDFVLRSTESGIGGETRKGLQPLRKLLALNHQFLVETTARS